MLFCKHETRCNPLGKVLALRDPDQVCLFCSPDESATAAWRCGVFTHDMQSPGGAVEGDLQCCGSSTIGRIGQCDDPVCLLAVDLVMTHQFLGHPGLVILIAGTKLWRPSCLVGGSLSAVLMMTCASTIVTEQDGKCQHNSQRYPAAQQRYHTA